MILAIIHSVRVVILGGLFLVDNVGLKNKSDHQVFPINNFKIQQSFITLILYNHPSIILYIQ